MQLKKGASLEGIVPQVKNAIETVNRIYEAHGHDLVVTSGTEGSKDDGVHRTDSKHYTGEAFDCRTFYFVDMEGKYDLAKVKAVAKHIREALGPDFDVLVEKDHIHVEYDPGVGSIGSLIKDAKRALDITGKFIVDITPFARTIVELCKKLWAYITKK